MYPSIDIPNAVTEVLLSCLLIIAGLVVDHWVGNELVSTMVKKGSKAGRCPDSPMKIAEVASPEKARSSKISGWEI